MRNQYCTSYDHCSRQLNGGLTCYVQNLKNFNQDPRLCTPILMCFNHDWTGSSRRWTWVSHWLARFNHGLTRFPHELARFNHNLTCFNHDLKHPNPHITRFIYHLPPINHNQMCFNHDWTIVNGNLTPYDHALVQFNRPLTHLCHHSMYTTLLEPESIELWWQRAARFY